MRIYGKSVRGKREYNQDRIYYRGENNCFIMAVADGVGGSSGGGIASRIAADVCEQLFGEFSADPSARTLKDTIINISEVTTSRIRERAEKEPRYLSMATTLTLAIGRGESFAVGNIGDSRTYFISEGKAEQITEDHSYIREIEKKHNRPVSDLLSRRMSHVITKAVSRTESQIDLFPATRGSFTLGRGDILLLCSDGMIPDKLQGIEDLISSELEKAASLEEAPGRLIRWAEENGSSDNISIVIGEM